MAMKLYDIHAAAAQIGFSTGYVRTLIRKGKIKTELQPLHEGTCVLKHMIPETELQKFVDEVPHKSRRSDGRNKFIVYLRNDELLHARQLLIDGGLGEIAFMIQPANKLKHWEKDNGD
jgi:hypothetical protein